MAHLKFLSSTVLMLLISVFVFSQKKVSISDRYYGLVSVESPSEVFSPGWIAIYEKGTDRELIRVESEELAVDYTPEGEIQINVLQIPYGEQSVIIYDDFNFDGIKDFAIEDGQNSCYHGPSFQIYLGDTKGQFKYSDEFTDLAQFYCGMFNYDPSAKRIYTMTKSGCCWHQFSEFEVVDNKPVEIKVVEEGFVANGCFVETSTSEKIEGKMQSNVIYNIEYETDTVLSFTIAKNEKQVILFMCGEDLWYAFLTPKGDIEFAYPAISDIGSNDPYDFELRRDGDNEWLSFSTKDAQYQIYNELNKVGIRVTTKGRVYDQKGDISSRKGSISKVFFAPERDMNNVNFGDY